MSEEYGVSKWHHDYLKTMVEETLAEGARPIPLVPKEFKGKPIADLTAEERKEFLFSMQPKSTQEAIIKQRDRKPEDDLEYTLRPISEDYLAVKDAKSLDELVPMREISPDAYASYKAMQRREKNTKGTKGLSSVTPESRERAINAFTYSEPANPSVNDLKRLKKLLGLEAVPATEAPKAPVKLPWWQRWKPSKDFWARFWGTYHPGDE